VLSCVTAACTNCGAVPADEDTGMTPHFASTSQAAQELAQNWGWHHERRSEWPKDDVLLCPACAAPADSGGNPTPPARDAGAGQEPGAVSWWEALAGRVGELRRELPATLFPRPLAPRGKKAEPVASQQSGRADCPAGPRPQQDGDQAGRLADAQARRRAHPVREGPGPQEGRAPGPHRRRPGRQRAPRAPERDHAAGRGGRGIPGHDPGRVCELFLRHPQGLPAGHRGDARIEWRYGSPHVLLRLVTTFAGRLYGMRSAAARPRLLAESGQCPPGGVR
jgi:hypothetical protein